MISVLGIDELNTPKEYKERSIDYEKYFGEMDLTKEQKENRIATANEMENLMLFIFALLMTMNEYGLLDFNYVRQQLTSRYKTIMGNAGAVDDYLRIHAEDFADSFIESTEIKMDNPWYLSEDRARFIAENEANVVHNYLEYEKAIKAGYTKKQWITFMDGKERKSHAKLNKKTIPILELFAVGDTFMRFPKDMEYASDFPKETVNCRCRVKYLERDPERAEKYEKIGLALSDNAGGLIVDGDEFVPCLRDVSTGELVDTFVEKVDRKNLKGYNKSTGWYVNWSEMPKDASIFKLTVAGDDEIQGLIAMTPDKANSAMYLNWAVSAPHNNPQKLNGAPKKYEGVGGHLMAIAAEQSLANNFGGACYGYAANRILAEYYMRAFGAVPIPAPNGYGVFYDEDAMKKLLEIYNYAWK